MNLTELNSESERLATAAQAAIASKRTDEGIALYRKAAELEKQALDLLEPSKTRTRGITAVSAVALWFKGHEYALAEKLAYSMLGDSDIPDFARQDLRTLVQAIWTEGTKKQAGVTFMPGQVLVSVKGGDIVTGGAPLDLVVDKVQTIQSMFYRTIELANGVTLRRVGRPSKELQDACRPWLFQAPPGSYQFSIAIQKPAQPDFFRQDFEPELIAQQFLQIVSAASTADRMNLEQLVPDKGYRDTFLKLTRSLAPTGNTFERIEFRTSGETRPVSINGDARATINKELREQRDGEDQSKGTPEEIVGVLRALHLDKDWLEVHVGSTGQRVTGLRDAVDDVIGPMVNRTVRVQAIRSNRNKLKYVDIELAE